MIRFLYRKVERNNMSKLIFDGEKVSNYNIEQSILAILNTDDAVVTIAGFKRKRYTLPNGRAGCSITVKYWVA
jgi:hypothetical protein